MKTVTIYTDGACSGNPGPGGWGAILSYNGHEKELSGGEANTTNNRMELTAVITALATLKEPCEVTLTSDSKYVIDGITKGWAESWKRRGWIKGLFSSVGVYFALSMALGGVMTALYHLLNRTGAASLLAGLSEGGGDGLGSWLFLLLVLVGGAVSLWGGRLLGRSRAVRLCTVTVELDGRSVTLRGIVDSGNLLRDPIGGRAVICAEKKALTELLSLPLMAVMEGMPPQAVSLSPSDAKRIRVIPADTATGGGILYGFFPDKVMLTAEDGGAAREVDAVVAVTSIPTNGVAALIPADLI